MAKALEFEEPTSNFHKLSTKGQESFLVRIMERNELSIRTITSCTGKSLANLTENENHK